MFVWITLHHFLGLSFIQFLDFLSFYVGRKLGFDFNLSLRHVEILNCEQKHDVTRVDAAENSAEDQIVGVNKT